MNRMLRLLCAAACLLLLLAGCGKKEIEPPEFYQIGDDQAITLDTCLGPEHENGNPDFCSFPQTFSGLPFTLKRTIWLPEYPPALRRRVHIGRERPTSRFTDIS